MARLEGRASGLGRSFPQPRLRGGAAAGSVACVHNLDAYWEPLDFELPSVDDSGASPSRRSIDTALESPQDIVPRQTAPAWSGLTYRTAAHSVVVPFAEIRRRPPPIGQEQERPKGAQWERRGQAESQRLAGQIRIVDGERGPYGRAGDQESKADDACRSQRPSSQEATPAIALLDRQAATGFAVSLRGTTPGVAVKPEAR